MKRHIIAASLLAAGLFAAPVSQSFAAEPAAGRPSVVIVHGVDQGQAAQIWVAGAGPAYPLRLVGTSSGTATLDLLDYGAPVRITAPASALDATEVVKLISGG